MCSRILTSHMLISRKIQVSLALGFALLLGLVVVINPNKNDHVAAVYQKRWDLLYWGASPELDQQVLSQLKFGIAEEEAVANLTSYSNFGLFSRLSWRSTGRPLSYGFMGNVFFVDPTR
ncbi:MAG: hypothetical protein ACI8W8_005079 [Rhodothermales bacterium]|jgi:hypothetical protein